MKSILISLIGLVIWSCQSSQKTNSLKDVVIEKNRTEIRNYFKEQKPNQSLYDIERQRSYIINSLTSSELGSDTLIVYETLFSNVSANYNCVIYSSDLDSIRNFTEKSRLQLTKDGAKLDIDGIPLQIHVCLINTIRKKGVFNWSKSILPFTGDTRYFY